MSDNKQKSKYNLRISKRNRKNPTVGEHAQIVGVVLGLAALIFLTQQVDAVSRQIAVIICMTILVGAIVLGQRVKIQSDE